MGNNSLTVSQVPVAVTATGVLAGKTVIAVAAGEDHSLALCSDGTLAAWGQNGAGQLGNNSLTDSPVPVVVSTAPLAAGERFVAAASGPLANHSLALVAAAAASPPTITTPPQSQVVPATSNVTFTVAATGSGLTYQWRKGGVDLGGATSDTLTLNSVTRAASGVYSVVVTSGGSSTPSSAATLRVIVPQQLQPPQRGGGGQFQIRFNDPDGVLGSDLSRFEVHHTTNFLGASTVWITNSGSFTLSNGKILFNDTGSIGAPRRFYRVIEK